MHLDHAPKAVARIETLAGSDRNQRLLGNFFQRLGIRRLDRLFEDVRAATRPGLDDDWTALLLESVGKSPDR